MLKVSVSLPLLPLQSTSIGPLSDKLAKDTNEPAVAAATVLIAKLCPTLCNPRTVAHKAPLSMWDFPGKNTGVGCPFLLQGIFQTQGWNPRLLYWYVDSLPLSHQGSSPVSYILPNSIQIFYTISFYLLATFNIDGTLSLMKHFLTDLCDITLR